MLILLPFMMLFGLSLGQCPNGDPMYAYGLSDEEKRIVVQEHNKYRDMIRKGQVPGQPRGINIKDITYDEDIAETTYLVSITCKMEHNIPQGMNQNIHHSASTNYDVKANWTDAVWDWYSEHTKYHYPGGFRKATAHYTQLVWDSTDKIGCGYVMYKDSSDPVYPYNKLYTCNYKPPGNVNNLPPYKTG